MYVSLSCDVVPAPNLIQHERLEVVGQSEFWFSSDIAVGQINMKPYMRASLMELAQTIECLPE
jgi:hypothetical protein